MVFFNNDSSASSIAQVFHACMTDICVLTILLISTDGAHFQIAKSIYCGVQRFLGREGRFFLFFCFFNFLWHIILLPNQFGEDGQAFFLLVVFFFSVWCCKFILSLPQLLEICLIVSIELFSFCMILVD